MTRVILLTPKIGFEADMNLDAIRENKGAYSTRWLARWECLGYTIFLLVGGGLYVEVKTVAILGKKVKTNDVFTGRMRSGRVGEVMGKGQDVERFGASW